MRRPVPLLPALTALCLGAAFPHSGRPQDALCDVPLNKVQHENADEVLAYIKSGKDPCRGWLARESGFASDPVAIRGFFHNTIPIYAAHRPATKLVDADESEACLTYSDTHAGGNADEAAITACTTGEGKSAQTSGDISVRVPEVERKEIDCLVNIFKGLTNGSGFNIGAAIGGGIKDGCAEGNIGLCGLSLFSGKVCLPGGENDDPNANPPPDPETVPHYIPLGDVQRYRYEHNEINKGTAIILPHGGLVETQGASYPVPQSGVPGEDDAQQGRVIMDEDGNLKIRPARNNNRLNNGNRSGPYTDSGLRLGYQDVATIIPVDGEVAVHEAIFKAYTIDGSGHAQWPYTSTYAGPNNPIGETQIDEEPNNGPSETPPEEPTRYGGTTDNGRNAGAFPAVEPSLHTVDDVTMDVEVDEDVVDACQEQEDCER